MSENTQLSSSGAPGFPSDALTPPLVNFGAESTNPFTEAFERI
jgi:hypothetical protein